ncbi:hypothetical protein VTJ49DRAFT_4885 [Mycothermus thermophilus]|uniref:Uncharacterized protein n=1 Tax=Humicola insolens TaxID=85995 RepID=A0ABR3V4C8_HUMIN
MGPPSSSLAESSELLWYSAILLCFLAGRVARPLGPSLKERFFIDEPMLVRSRMGHLNEVVVSSFAKSAPASSFPAIVIEAIATAVTFKTYAGINAVPLTLFLLGSP